MWADEIPEDDDCGYCGGGFYSSNGEVGGCAECNNDIRREYREEYPRGLLDEFEEATIDWLPGELRVLPHYQMPITAHVTQYGPRTMGTMGRNTKLPTES